MAEATTRPSPFADQTTFSWTLRRFWRQRARPLWRTVRAPLVLLLAIGVLILGTVGFSSEGYDWWEAFFKSFQLFALAGGDVSSESPPSLNIARVLAPLLVGYAAVRGLIALSREQLRLLGFRLFRRNHVVVAGLGDVGFRLANVVNERGGRVIAIDRDNSNPSLEGCRVRGISVLAGDATDESTLKAACVHRAAHLIVAPGVDAVTLDIVAAAEGIIDERTGAPLRVLAHVEGRALGNEMRARGLTQARRTGIDVELFNLYEEAGKLILADHPPFSAEAIGGRRIPSVLILSDQLLGEILAVNIARSWSAGRIGSGERIRIDLASPDAVAACERILARHPNLKRACELEPWEIEPDRPALRDDPRVAEAATVYVALDDEASALASCLGMATARDEAGEVVLIANDQRLGAASVADACGSRAPIAVFGILSRTLKPDFVTWGLTEQLARAVHANYVSAQLAKGETRETLPNLVPWDELPEDIKQSNRDVAGDIHRKLDAVGRDLVPSVLVNLDDPDASFDEAEIEVLAELEHERWMREKTDAGWSYGPERDDKARVHPNLVPYAELTEDDKDKDRDVIRELPKILADAGFAIVRV